MLRPPDGPVEAAQGIDAFADADRASAQRDETFEPDLRERQQRSQPEPVIGDGDRVRRHRCVAMHGQARGRLFNRRPAEDVEADVMTHDAGEQDGLGAGAVRVAVERRIVGGRLDRRPRRGPERIDPGLLVEHLGDVSAFREHGDTDALVLDRGGTAPVIDLVERHCASLWIRSAL